MTNQILNLDLKAKTEELVNFISKTVKSAGFNKVVVAVSGGVDSAVSLSLAVRALGPDNVYPLVLPCGKLSEKATQDALEIINLLEIPEENLKIVNIEALVSNLADYDEGLSSIRKGNIMARVRMIIVFDQAKKLECLVVGTENKSEHLLGYFTRFGDEASDLEPIVGLYKTQVYQLAEYLNVPQAILQKAPSANLWEGQGDEAEFGFTYKQGDQILAQMDSGATEKDLTLHFPPNLVQLVLQRVRQNAYKQQVPYLVKTKNWQNML